MTEIEEKSKWSWKEFLETAAVGGYLFVAFGMNQITLVVILYLCYTSKIGLCFFLLWFIWIYLDRHIHETGGRRWEMFRNLAWWRYFRFYFPIYLHKTEELRQDRNYLLAVFPHGILSAGVYSTFGTNAHDLGNLFPGLTFYIHSLKVLFYVPLLRELLLMSGVVSATPQSLLWMLGSPGVGRAAVLVAGGAKEALHNEPGVYKILLNRRKGFCRVALQTGASLVPVLALGEVDVYEIGVPAPGTALCRLQHWVKDTTGILPVRFRGKGLFEMLPKRKPIHVIVGSPIHTEKTAEVTEENVEKLHKEYRISLVKLFEENKQYLDNPNSHLEFA